MIFANSPGVSLGNSVLITGGAGFFGRGFARRLLDAGVPRVCIYSRDEFKQHQMRQEFAGEDRIRFFIGDVRDVERLRRAMDGCDVVVHAAALKRVEVGEYDPGEMVKTNVDGARNVIEAAFDCCVEKVVALSTDKAFEPVNAYGASKLLAEKLFLGANNGRGAHGPRFAVTRYGNVAGSTGSVIPIWRELLAAGRMVTVRDPNATRFWMTLEEACGLVANTIVTMDGGELNVPSLPAYAVGDLAHAMGVFAGPFTYSELGAGEKLHEGMERGNTSDNARAMSIEELKEALSHV
jgi:UDP-N-acetylglucosamine 4,6-dehydratase